MSAYHPQVPVEIRQAPADPGVALAGHVRPETGERSVRPPGGGDHGRYSNAGNAVKRREDMHKMREANKAFAHYRW